MNTMCSMKWAAPPSPGFSLREPVPTQMPREAERTEGTCSVTMRTPLGRTCVLYASSMYTSSYKSILRAGSAHMRESLMRR